MVTLHSQGGTSKGTVPVSAGSGVPPVSSSSSQVTFPESAGGFARLSGVASGRNASPSGQVLARPGFVATLVRPVQVLNFHCGWEAETARTHLAAYGPGTAGGLRFPARGGSSAPCGTTWLPCQQDALQCHTASPVVVLSTYCMQALGSTAVLSQGALGFLSFPKSAIERIVTNASRLHNLF